MAMDIQQPSRDICFANALTGNGKAKHGHRRDDPDTETESSLDSTDAPL